MTFSLSCQTQRRFFFYYVYLSISISTMLGREIFVTKRPILCVLVYINPCNTSGFRSLSNTIASSMRVGVGVTE